MVKKYGNRRLYDTRDSRYVNLEELVELFGADEQLQVLDAVTGDDLTEKTLRQAILADENKRKIALVPPDLLRALIRYRRGASRADFERHITKAVASFAGAKK
ncbi:MAG TPA: polyhydroxyalkanoate synthesis regulator DNA-binding domain-containing protein [Polyangia bacterium]|nr:polyhydroxyalkanoate synthesis regulator DNA-binding domain-containing protein [Polyangia bacterium]